MFFNKKIVRDVLYIIFFSLLGVALIITSVGAFSRGDVFGGVITLVLGVACLILAGLIGLYSG